MHTPSRIVLAASLGAGLAAANSLASICMMSPVPTVIAGRPIVASIENQQNLPCQATLEFADENFSKVTFQLLPFKCVGSQQATIVVPREAPNGLVTVSWECSGQENSSCSRAIIEGGLGKIEELLPVQQGKVECVVPTATQTSFLTVTTGVSSTLRAVVETLFTTEATIQVTSQSGSDPTSRSGSGAETISPTSTPESSTATTSVSPLTTSIKIPSTTNTSSTLSTTLGFLSVSFPTDTKITPRTTTASVSTAESLNSSSTGLVVVIGTSTTEVLTSDCPCKTNL